MLGIFLAVVLHGGIMLKPTFLLDGRFKSFSYIDIGVRKDGAEIDEEGIVRSIPDDGGVPEAESFGQFRDGLVFWGQLDGH